MVTEAFSAISRSVDGVNWLLFQSVSITVLKGQFTQTTDNIY